MKPWAVVWLGAGLAAVANAAGPHHTLAARAIPTDKAALAKRQDMGMSVLSTGMIAASDVPVVSPAAAAATGVSGKGGGSGGSSSPAGAASVGGNATAGPPGGDLDLTVLNLAVVLESLESSFYQTALKTFSAKDYVSAGWDPTIAQIIVEQVTVIQVDESTHLKSLSNAVTALGGTPASKACKFDLSAAMADPTTFLATARTLEQVGVGGYLGAASLLSDPAVLTSAGSVLTIEARHSALLDTFSGGSPVSQAFDLALSPPQVLALAGGFLSGCQASDLGLTTNQPLSVMDTKTKSTSFAVGSQLALNSTAAVGGMGGMSCQLLTGGAVSAMVMPAEKCMVPESMQGPVAVFLTKSSTPLASNLQVQNSADIMAGPGLIFIDSASKNANTLGTVFSSGKALPSTDMGGWMMSKQSGSKGGRIVVEVDTEVVVRTRTRVIIDGASGGGDGGSGSSGSKSSSSKASRDLTEPHAVFVDLPARGLTNLESASGSGDELGTRDARDAHLAHRHRDRRVHGQGGATWSNRNAARGRRAAEVRGDVSSRAKRAPKSHEVKREEGQGE